MGNVRSNSQVLKLDDVNNQIASAQVDIANYQATLRSACFNSISPDDMQDIVQKQIKKAKAGDLNAAKFMMNLIGSNRPMEVKQTNVLVADTETAARLARNCG